MLEGIDVYHGDGPIDWLAVRDSGRTFAFVKAAEGLSADTRFDENWQGLKEAALCRGAYHFARPKRGADGTGTIVADALAQADFFYSVVGPLDGDDDLPPVLDLESNKAGLTNDEMLDWTRTFVARATALFGRVPIMYVGHYWRGELKDPVVPELAECALWTPRYGSEPIMPRCWSKWHFWQYTDGKAGPRAGSVPGVAKPCDCNVFNGDLDALRALGRLSSTP